MKKIIFVLTLFMLVNTGAQAAYKETVMQDAEIVNGDFEMPVLYDASEDPDTEYGDLMNDRVDGWEDNGTSQDFVTPGINKYTIEEDPENSNNHCLLIWDTRQAQNGASTTNVWSGLIPAAGGSNIKTSINVYLKYDNIGVNESGTTINSRALYMKVCYFNSAGTMIGSEPQVTHSNAAENKNTWKTVEFPVYQVPEGASYIRLIAMSTNAHTAKAYIDDFKISIMNEKSVSDPVFSTEKLNPGESTDITVDIKNNTGSSFEVYMAAGLYNSEGEIIDVQTADNSWTSDKDSNLEAQVTVPEDAAGCLLRVMLFTLDNNRLKVLYKWVEMQSE